MRADTVISSLPCVGALTGALIGAMSGGSWIHGAGVGMLAGFSPLVLLYVLCIYFSVWCPLRPDCLCGNCNSDGYEFVGMNEGYTEFHYRCGSCGREYVSVDDGYYELVDGRRCLRFAKTKFGRWKAC